MESAAPRRPEPVAPLPIARRSRRNAEETAQGSPRPAGSLGRHGRGATINPAVRFEATERVLAEDGWGSLDAELSSLPPLETTLIRDRSRSAITRNTSPDLGFDRSINPYRGCEHGCVYCFARPSHAYLGYSPGLDFETKLLFKPEVARLLEQELRRPSYRPRPITLGANTDPYQPIERRLRLTREVLEVLRRFRHPVSIVTKSASILRDVDLLGALAAEGLVHVFLSITTLDAELARVMEPRASAPALRLRAVSGLRAAGIPVGILAAPIIPGVNDAELEAILQAAARHGAGRAGYVLLRLPLELREIFEAWLREHLPARADRVLNLIRSTRSGALYDSRFGERLKGSGAYADLLAQRFALAARKNGLAAELPPLNTALFQAPPEETAAPVGQMSLF
ncbi:radical SAM protein [Acidisoma sp. C75]